MDYILSERRVDDDLCEHSEQATRLLKHIINHSRSTHEQIMELWVILCVQAYMDEEL